jgi:hypothetical protein
VSGPDEPTVSDAASLCRACGLCCRGVWFKSTTLEPEEVDTARMHGFAVMVQAGECAVSQPCAKFRDGECANYHTWRPAACHHYRCRVLAEFEAGTLSGQAALAHVSSALGMAQRIWAEVGPLEGGIRGEAFLQLLDAPAGPDSLSASARLDVVSLHLYYEKHFENHEPGSSS